MCHLLAVQLLLQLFLEQRSMHKAKSKSLPAAADIHCLLPPTCTQRDADVKKKFTWHICHLARCLELMVMGPRKGHFGSVGMQITR